MIPQNPQIYADFKRVINNKFCEFQRNLRENNNNHGSFLVNSMKNKIL